MGNHTTHLENDLELRKLFETFGNTVWKLLMLCFYDILIYSVSRFQEGPSILCHDTCFLDLMRKKVRSFIGSRSRTTLRACDGEVWKPPITTCSLDWPLSETDWSWFYCRMLSWVTCYACLHAQFYIHVCIYTERDRLVIVHSPGWWRKHAAFTES